MKKAVLTGAVLATTLMASATVTLPQFFTNNMVVQQNATLTIPGTANPNSKVKVVADWLTAAIETKADSKGAFSLSLPTPAAGGPYTIVVSDDTKNGEVVLANILAGEVWLCSGQSNMEFPIQGWGKVMDADGIVATARHPEIRLLQIHKNIAYTPQADAEVNMGGWVEATPATMDFTAIGYLYALEMQKELNVPIGIIDTTWGGTPAESWTSLDYLKSVPGFEEEISAINRCSGDADLMQEDYEKRDAEWLKQLDERAIKIDPGKLQKGKSWGKMPIPGYWESSVLSSFDGVVWLQKTVNISSKPLSSIAEINLGPIDDQDIVYINGTKVGEGNAWFAPRHYEFSSSLLKVGENIITIRITDTGANGGIGGEKEACYLNVDREAYSLAGDWNYSIALDYKDMPLRPTVVNTQNYPTVLFNAMINPLNVLPIKGVLWYQGCTNVGRAEQYEPLFQAMINNWRNHWNTNFPFYFVQLAGFLTPRLVQADSEWAALRNSQAKALSLPNTGMAVAIDLGNPADIHPTNKQDVAHRLALLALNRTYGRNVVDAAPTCNAVNIAGNKITLTFDGPVSSTAGVVTGFIIGDASGNYAYASSRQTSPTTIELTSPLISKPTIARYNWADFPDGNLTGETGLPVAPFATDK